MKILFLILALSVAHLQAASIDDLTWETSEGIITITDCDTSASGTLEIPAQIGGTPVSVIGHSTFIDCTALLKITLPPSIIEIRKSAFENCRSLASINLPPALTSLQPRLFYSCRGLIELEIPNAVTTIQNEVFAGALNLETVNLPDNLTTIGAKAFAGSKLTSLNVPIAITEIGTEAFSNCTSLIQVSIHGPIETLQEKTFSRCLNLQSVQLPADLQIIGDYAFHYCANLISINLPDTITRIGDGAFDGCEAVEGIVLPENLSILGLSALRRCDKLVSVTIPESLTSIGNGALSYCSSLSTINPVENHPTLRSIDGVLFDKEITTIVQYPGGKIDPHYEIPDTVTSFEGYGCFAKNRYLKRITIPEGLNITGDWAFSFCSNLQEINFPQSSQVTGWVSFSDCTSLETVTIPANVVTINNGTFTNCTSLRKVVFEGPATDPEWGSNAFRNIGNFPYALVKPEHAESFGGVGATWRGLEVRIDPPTPRSFAEAALEQGLTGESALPSADPSQRGVANGIAYALGLPMVGPLTPEHRRYLPTLVSNPGDDPPLVEISIPTSPPADVTYVIMISHDLTDWREIGRRDPGAPWTGEITVEETSLENRVITAFSPTRDAEQTGAAFLQLKVVTE